MTQSNAQGAIEIAFDVVTKASIVFWFDKAKWQALTTEEKNEAIERRLDAMFALTNEPYFHQSEDGHDLSLCVELIERDLAQEPTIYDPAE